MSTTKVLREQSGIQYQGVQDKSEASTSDSLSNVIIAGIFKRGRFDRPMKITKSNVRSKLGFDPQSKVYQAVEDALATGVPYVWVQRIAGGGLVNPQGYGLATVEDHHGQTFNI